MGLTVLMFTPESKAYLRQLLGSQEQELYEDYGIQTRGILEVLEDGSTVAVNYVHKGDTEPTPQQVKIGVDIRKNREVTFLCGTSHTIYGQAYLCLLTEDGTVTNIPKDVAKRYEKMFNKGM